MTVYHKKFDKLRKRDLLVLNIIYNLKCWIMSKKNIFLLAAGYVLGGVVASLYNKKKPEDLKKELKDAKASWESDLKVLFDNFVETHKNLLKDLEWEIMSEKNKKLFEEKKAQLLEIAYDYRSKGNELLEELKVKGKEFIVEASAQLEKMYEEKKWELEELKDVSPEKVEDLKKNLLAIFNEIKEKMKKMK